MGTKNLFELKTPDLGDTDKIELIKWYSEVGQSIEEGDEILELVTDKAAFPVESPVSGVLLEIKVPEGSIVQKDQLLGIMELIQK
ncbi:MAG TPA: lipoyl domain-containing protein [Leptospiraceae bacterium]|nr:lipoyl domain-containing protein [Leptospiraceae bacterium]HMW05798.1 lipoyl domain-containing protein [Leptospiraceae bacterium]HMX32613.1 lipoyl domain-containing protein [Leptospiraceae bacterium]HMY33921.1 lipoyl domain-containing protein [Leptospiraceae bacterium]HMZ67471.1 lipoyl domain-containing protein [Leptospiraceae bacterium]